MASESMTLFIARFLVHPYLRHDVDRGAMLSMTNVLPSPFTSEFPSPTSSRSCRDTHPALEIRRGRSQHPLRPIASFPFLIGTGDQCDLQLGGNDIPSLHSVITIESGKLHIECIVPIPPLQVAGCEVESAILTDDDSIHIGEFEFRVQLPENGLAMSHPDEVDSFEAIDDRPLGALSTDELLDRLERDMQLVEQFDQGQEAGAEALMDSILARAQSLETVDTQQPMPEPLETAGESQIAIELEQVLDKMTEFSLELESRSERQTQREASYAEAAATLSETQQRLASQLETLTEQVASLQRPTPMPWRASA
jgi:hypothetical protein